MITAKDGPASNRPVTQQEMLKSRSAARAKKLDCTMFPMPRAATAAKRAKQKPSHFQFWPKPFLMEYMGPPT